MLKKSVMSLYVVVVVVMAAATIVEKYQGSAYVSSHIYGAWWFSLLWGVLAAAAIFYFLRRKVRRLFVVALHLSFVIILTGALLTHLTAKQGMIHLRNGEQTNRYITMADNGTMEEHPLPFTLRLDSFKTVYHEGTMAAADYQSFLTVIDDVEHREVVSMNNIVSHRSIRLYQSSFDEDGRGSLLSMNSDPWGIPVTYTGYALLFISLVWMLFDPKGTYRALLRKSAALTVFFMVSGHAAAQKVLPAETADKFGRICIVYNDRVCPLQTYAIDFTKKLYGKTHYGDLTAEQVLTGFIFWGDEWNNEPIIRIKSGELKSALQLPDYVSVNQFFNEAMGGYTLGPYIQEYYQGRRTDGFHKQAAKIDDQIQLVMELQHGTPLKVFPYATQDHGNTTASGTAAIRWFAPTGQLPEAMDSVTRKYISQTFNLMYEEVLAAQYEKVNKRIDELQKYQQQHGGSSLQSETAFKAERMYNRVPFATILFMLCLTLAFVSLLKWPVVKRISYVLLCASFLALTLCLALRWVIVQHIPMSNGYETMLLLAWFIQLLTLVSYRRFRIMLTFGLLMSGFFLLVSHISLMDPQMSHMMPVLQSPLLSLHVSIIMMAYALLSMTFICGVTGLFAKKQSGQLQLLSQLMLYPAITTLGIGIFLGAIWANISWGTYWSWDPKEVWALITFMIYGAAVHAHTIPQLQKPRNYHLFMTLAFLTILMTYFGVNYFLGGMHSYA